MWWNQWVRLVRAPNSGRRLASSALSCHLCNGLGSPATCAPQTPRHDSEDLYWGRDTKEKVRASGLLGGLGSSSVVVQVAPQGCGVISDDAGGPQAVGCFKIRLFVKAPKDHLGRDRGAHSFTPSSWNFPVHLDGGSSPQWRPPRSGMLGQTVRLPGMLQTGY